VPQYVPQWLEYVSKEAGEGHLKLHILYRLRSSIVLLNALVKERIKYRTV
jgi:hypothetical protein